MIILFFGQPASGKTTLADKYRGRLLYDAIMKNEESFKRTIRIDGDKWRDITKNKDYSKEGRYNNLKGAFDMALYLEREGIVPILSFVTPYEELRRYLYNNCQSLAAIYLTYSVDRGRDSLFANDFEEPIVNCLKIDTSEQSIDDCLNKISLYVTEKNRRL
jgi:adenylylsulfate kinase-like enzyme